MKTNLRFLVVFILSLSTVASYSQNSPDSGKNWMLDIKNSNNDLFKVRANAQAYYNANPGLKTTKGSGYKQFVRWETYWQDRMYKANSTKGSSSYAIDAYRQLVNKNSPLLSAGKYNNGGSSQINSTFCGGYSTATSDWSLVGPSQLTTANQGIVVSLAYDPSDATYNTVYAGTNVGGLWKTTNGGSTWTNITDSYGWPGMGIEWITIHPTNSQIIYVCAAIFADGRSYGIGLLKTTNGGASWSSVNLSSLPSDDRMIRKMIIDPSNTNRMYALVEDQVYRTTDGGATWSVIFNNLTQWTYRKKELRDIEMKPGDPNTIYISSDGFHAWTNPVTPFPAELWKTTNATSGTVTWTQLSAGTTGYIDNIAIAISPANSNAVFLGYAHDSNSDNNPDKFRIRKSTNNGGAWTNIVDQTFFNSYGGAFNGVGYYCLELEVSPTDIDVVYAGGFHISKVTNNGGTVNLMESGIGSSPHSIWHVDNRAIMIARGSTSGAGGNIDMVFVGHDGGVTKTSNGGTNWACINGSYGGGLKNTQFYGIAGVESNPDHIIGGTQDNGAFTLNSGTWTVNVLGDAYDGLINYNNSSIAYATANGGSPTIHKSTNGGVSWNGSISQPSGPCRNNRSLVMHPTNPDIIYIGHHDVQKTINGGLSWAAISNFTSSHSVPSGDKLSAVAVYDGDPNIIYAAFEGPTYANPSTKRLFKTTNGGTSWTDVTPGATNYAGITGIAISSTDPNKVWLSMGGFWGASGDIYTGYNRVIHSSNGGTSWSDHVAWSNGLPNLPVNTIRYYKGSTGDELFVGNDVGVYYRNNSLGQWVCFGNNLPACIVQDLEINYSARKIRAATYGRGIWESDLPCYYTGGTETINTNTTWSTPTRKFTDVVIEPGATLTITAKISMPYQSKIIVKRGAQLIVNTAGVLTSACNTLWNGVEVWGDRNQRQLTTYQGKVQVNNGGVIENAVDAITTIKRNPMDWNYTGGIVQCNGGIFRNNNRAVEFLSYQNKNTGGSPIPNISYFHNCTFEITSPVLAPSILPGTFVTLYDTDGEQFLGNTFRNTALTTYTEPDRGAAIYSIDAKYIVNQWCTNPVIQPCTSWQPNTFQGLTYGIRSDYSSGNLRNITVHNNIFTNVQQGVQCVGGAYSNIQNNTFTVPSWWFGGDPIAYPFAVRMDGATNFSVNYNTINGAGTQADYNWGVIVENSVNSASTTKGNVMAKLNVGTQTQHNNGSGTTGLQINCNSYNTSYTYAWSINPESSSGSLPTQGTCGSSANQAGNTWNSGSTAPANQIYSTIAFTYNANNVANGFPTYRSSNVTAISCNPYNTNSCATGGGGGGEGELAGNSSKRVNRTSGQERGEQLRQLNEQIQKYLAEDNLEAAILLLKDDNTPESKQILAMTYLQYKQFDKLQPLVSEIKSNKYLEKDREDVLNILNDLYSNNKGLFDLSAAQENILRNKLSSDNLSKYCVQSILSFTKGEKFHYKVEQIQENEAESKSRTAASISEAQSLNKAWLSDNMPNPFSDVTMVEAYIPAENSSGNIVIYDALGSQVAIYNLQKGRNAVEIKLNNLAKGIYVYSLEINGEKIITKKMALIR